MRTFIHRKRYLIAACALTLATIAGVGMFALQANADSLNVAAEGAVEQAEDEAVLKADDVSDDSVNAAQEVADKTEEPRLEKRDGAEPTKAEAAAASDYVEANVEAQGDEADDEATIVESRTGLYIDGEATESSGYIEVNVAALDEEPELEERTATAAK